MRILVSMATTTKKLRLRRGDRRVLESWVRSRTLPRRQVERAKIVLAAFRGESSRGIAASVGIARDTARLWMRRYEADGLDGIERDRPRPGRPRKITRKVEEDIVQKTTGENPAARGIDALDQSPDGQGPGHRPCEHLEGLAQVRTPSRIRSGASSFRAIPALSRSSTTWWAST